MSKPLIRSVKGLIFKTFNEWREDGYHVIRGSVCFKLNEYNESVFSNEQVEQDCPYSGYYAMDDIRDWELEDDWSGLSHHEGGGFWL